jgi:hypothetical protein
MRTRESRCLVPFVAGVAAFSLIFTNYVTELKGGLDWSRLRFLAVMEMMSDYRWSVIKHITYVVQLYRRIWQNTWTIFSYRLGGYLKEYVLLNVIVILVECG